MRCNPPVDTSALLLSCLSWHCSTTVGTAPRTARVSRPLWHEARAAMSFLQGSREGLTTAASSVTSSAAGGWVLAKTCETEATVHCWLGWTRRTWQFPLLGCKQLAREGSVRLPRLLGLWYILIFLGCTTGGRCPECECTYAQCLPHSLSRSAL
jgi:hypothetical protein